MKFTISSPPAGSDQRPLRTKRNAPTKRSVPLLPSCCGAAGLQLLGGARMPKYVADTADPTTSRSVRTGCDNHWNNVRDARAHCCVSRSC
eukprot:COSAG02_NODE_60695_length_270_cov_1.187135_1_plen_89_part_11